MKRILVITVLSMASYTSGNAQFQFIEDAVKQTINNTINPNSNSTNTTPTPATNGSSSGSTQTSGKTNMGGNSNGSSTKTTNTNTQTGGKPSMEGNTNNTNTNTNTIGATFGGLVGAVTGSSGSGSTANFTQSEAANAIKEALTKGITKGVDLVSVTNGYFGNPSIKIPFPPQVAIVASTLQRVGAGSLVDKFVLQMNRSAEQAAKKATPVFVNSIKQMTISDAINIVSNQQPDAATKFLQRTTTDQLVAAFRPSIKTALDKTYTTSLWSQIMTTYNKVPLVQKVNLDLTDFVTRKALDGLFYMVAKEEAKIRKDPAARTTDILKKVFGNIKL